MKPRTMHRRIILGFCLLLALLPALFPQASRSETVPGPRLLLLEQAELARLDQPGASERAVVSLPQGPVLVLATAAESERMASSAGLRIRASLPFDPEAQYACLPAGSASSLQPLYADGTLMLLASRQGFPASMERQDGFFRVPLKAFARILAPTQPAATSKALTYDPYIGSFVSQVSSTRLTSDDNRLAAFHTRATLSDSVYAAAQWIKAQFTGMGYTDVQYQTFTYSSTTQRNIVVTIPGTVHPDQYIIVDGHYDTTSPSASTNAPGADDNGTGVIALLEMARLIKNVPFDYSIRLIAFAAEEQGLYGSAAYAAMAQSTGMQIKLLINLDEIGYPPATWSTIVERDQGNSSSTNDAASYAYADTMGQAAAAYTSLAVTNGNIYASDYMPFESRGYVCIGLYEQGDNPYYHTTGDLPSTVNFSYVTDSVKLILATLMHVARVSDPNAPVLSGPASENLIEGQTVSFTVSASDLDSDPLTFGIRNRPAGATFDSTGTHTFTWTPTLSQAGVYDVLFLVNDGRGRSDSLTTHITVLDTAPKIVSTAPTSWETKVSAATAIRADFDKDLDVSTLDERAVQVQGAQSGWHSGTVSYDPVLRRLSFSPAAPFHPGELVTADFSNSFKAMTGYSHEGYVLQFVIDTPQYSDGSLSSFATYPVGNTPLGIAAADLDGDGAVDLAVTNFYGNNVSLLWNSGGLSFTAGNPVTVGNGPQGIVAADLDKDGLVDIAVTLYNANQVAILWNEGNGNFSGPLLLTGSVGPRSLVAADLDGDGRPDLATVNGLSDNASVFLNLGSRSFAVQTTFAVGDDPYFLCAADFDGDGHLDLAAVKSSTPRVVVLKNQGNGTFAAPVGYTAGTSPYGIAAGDVDGDGDPDLVVANGGSTNMSVLLNDGHGVFGSPVNYTAGNQPRALVLADLTGDGWLDAAVSNGYSDNVSVLLNAGNGTFAGALNDPVGDTPRCIAAADLDGDGDVDLATANTVTGNVTILRNQTQGSTGITPAGPARGLVLAANRPNPFRTRTVLSYLLPAPAMVDLGIYDIQGRLVRRLIHGPQAAGGHEAVWDGQGAGDHPAAGGIYLSRLTAGGATTSRNILLTR